MEKELDANIPAPPLIHRSPLRSSTSTIPATPADIDLPIDIEKILPRDGLPSSSSSSSSTIAPLDWDTTPLNPHNWSLAKRIHHTIVPAFYGFTISFSSSVYTPGIPSLQHEFHLSNTVALLGLSLYTLGLAFGPVIAAPLSETYGRRIVYFISMPVFAAFVACGGAAQSWGGVLA